MQSMHGSCSVNCMELILLCGISFQNATAVFLWFSFAFPTQRSISSLQSHLSPKLLRHPVYLGFPSFTHSDCPSSFFRSLQWTNISSFRSIISWTLCHMWYLRYHIVLNYSNKIISLLARWYCRAMCTYQNSSTLSDNAATGNKKKQIFFLQFIKDPPFQ